MSFQISTSAFKNAQAYSQRLLSQKNEDVESNRIADNFPCGAIVRSVVFSDESVKTICCGDDVRPDKTMLCSSCHAFFEGVEAGDEATKESALASTERSLWQKALDYVKAHPKLLLAGTGVTLMILGALAGYCALSSKAAATLECMKDTSTPIEEDLHTEHELTFTCSENKMVLVEVKPDCVLTEDKLYLDSKHPEQNITTVGGHYDPNCEQPFIKTVKSDNELRFGASKGVDFALEQIRGNTKVMLAELPKQRITDSSHIHLNTTHLYQDPEEVLDSRFLLHCKKNASEEPIRLEARYLLNQEALNEKLSDSSCKLDIKPHLLFAGDLKFGEKNSIKIDTNKMCKEGKIHNFEIKTFISSDEHPNFFTIENATKIFERYVHYFVKENKVINVDMSKACERLANEELLLICDGRKHHFIKPSVNLTAGNVNSLNFDSCTVTDSDAPLPHKALLVPPSPLKGYENTPD